MTGKELSSYISTNFHTAEEKLKFWKSFVVSKKSFNVSKLELGLVTCIISMAKPRIDVSLFLQSDKDIIYSLMESSLFEDFYNDCEKNHLSFNEIETKIVDFIKDGLDDNLIKKINNYTFSDLVTLDMFDINKLGGPISLFQGTMNISYCKEYSFGVTQTNYKFIKEITIKNMSDVTLKNATLMFKFKDNFVKIDPIMIDVINPCESIKISKINLIPDYEFLKNIDGVVKSEFIVELECNNRLLLSSTPKECDFYGPRICLSERYPGFEALFVVPSDSNVNNILKYAVKEKGSISSNSMLNGYLSNDKNDIILQIKSIYNAILEEDISYKTGVETVGHYYKVSLPFDVLDRYEGNVLDLAILFLSCFESSGLNGCLMKTNSRILVGVFLQDICMAGFITDDASKPLYLSSEDVNDMIFIDPSFVCYDSRSFEDAVSSANNVMSGANSDSAFELLDIKRARSEGINSLPLTIDEDSVLHIDYDLLNKNKESLINKDFNVQTSSIELEKGLLGKYDFWENKLLDLTRRNQLINYPLKGKGLQLFYYDLNDLFAAFQNDGDKYNLIERALNNEENFELTNPSNEIYNQLKSDFNAKNISYLIRTPQQKTSLAYFLKERRSNFEESGSNVLYMALGFVEYVEPSISKKPLYAPLILLPIDLIRHSKTSYSIKGREEPPFLNMSIFQFFLSNYQLNCDDLVNTINLERDDVDVNIIFNTIAEKIKHLKRCCIIKTAAINVFNFSKAVLWQDLKNNKQLFLKNHIVKALIDGRFVSKVPHINAISDNDNPLDVAAPMSTDSSQMAAIKACANGESFVLQGPPGTGKSQTITNMIVNAMYHKKTVLFVAEKMAALEVVQKRLEKLGLGSFILEAHSAKSDKVSIMDQFEKRINQGKTAAKTEEISACSNNIISERDMLNKAMNLLHKPCGYFTTCYGAMVGYLNISPNIEILKIDSDYLKSLTREEFVNCMDILDNINNSILLNHGYLNNPFLFYRNANYKTCITMKTVYDALVCYKEAFKNVNIRLDAFRKDNDVSFAINDTNLSRLHEFLKDDVNIKNCFTHLIGKIDDNYAYCCEMAISYLKDLKAICDTFLKRFDKAILNDNFTEDIAKYKAALNSKNFIKKILASNNLIKCFKQYALNEESINKKNLASVVEEYETIVKQKKWFMEAYEKCKDLFDPKSIDDIATFDVMLHESRYYSTKLISQKYQTIFPNNKLVEMVNDFRNNKIIDKDKLIDTFDKFNEASKMIKDAGFDMKLAIKYQKTSDKVSKMIDSMINRIDELQTWCDLLKHINNAKEHQLSFMIDYMDNIDNFQQNVKDVYMKSAFAGLFEEMFKLYDDGTLNPVSLKDNIRRYTSFIEKFKELSIHQTAAVISSLMPSITDDSPASSQQGIINKAIRNKCRGKSIRKLFEETKDILFKMFPVFLMSPTSCVQYLGVDMAKFDVVIFDEASQMPTSEAIGPIARGKSLVVVGDSKQLPPTSFFQNKTLDNIDNSSAPNILDECCDIQMPSYLLNWHYRSQHESLIRFSNNKYYNDELYTFPSPNDVVSKLSLVNTLGVYEVKKAINKKEAEAIVKEVTRRLKSSDLRNKSIGIVTFSAAQQEVIEDMLYDLFSKDKALEKVAASLNEPIIVKNLENIQGDERDVILLSCCYGPNKEGKMYYRFGPINNDGGEKRLNVAITRARYEMIVYTSFEPEILRNMESISKGANDLFSFLMYAKNGPESLILENGQLTSIFPGFEKQLAEELRNNGLQVTERLGKSSFKVDLAIVDPEDSNNYILGIICDSYSYEKVDNCKDSNIVLPNALKSLGWNIFRVYSFNFLENRKKVVKDITNQINEILARRKQGYAPTNDDKDESVILEKVAMDERKNFSTKYIAYRPSNRKVSINSAFVVSNTIATIIDKESPICKELLIQRVKEWFDLKRYTDDIHNIVMKTLKNLNVKSNQNAGKTKTFFWSSSSTPSLSKYRISDPKDRTLDQICKEEIILAIYETLFNHTSLSLDDLKHCVLKAFGYPVLIKSYSETIDDCISYYVSKGYLFIDNNQIVSIKK